MDYEFLTPKQIWGNFNPDSEPLEISALSEYTENGVKYTSLYFTAIGSGKRSKRIRAYGLLAKPNKSNGKAILYLGSADEHVDKKYLAQFVERGYITFMVDYAGGESEFDTVYPEGLEYCNFDRAERHLTHAEPSALHSVWYWWSVIAMRAVTVLFGVSAEIAVVGVKEAVKMLFQVLAFDRRVKCGCAVLDTYSSEYDGIFKYGDKKFYIDAERECFISGTSPQSYAQFIKKPLLYIGATNSEIMDRLGDIFKKLPKDTQDVSYHTFSVGNEIVRDYEQNTLFKFLESVFDGRKMMSAPTLELNVSDGMLYAEIGVDPAVDEAEVYLSVGEIDPKVRMWQQLDVLKISKGLFIAKIEVNNIDKRIFVFAKSVKDGYTLSTREISVIPSELKVKKSMPFPTRILYDSSMGRKTLVPLAEHIFLGKKSLILKDGPFGIKGIYCQTKGFSIYADGDKSLAGIMWNEIQLDVYTERSTIISVSCFTQNEGKLDEYTTSIKLIPSKNWQRISIGEGEFKNTVSHLPLENMMSVKRIDFFNCDGVLFNNILKI